MRVYLDHHATTPVDAEVLEAMLPYFSERFGNAASKTHPWGWEGEEAVERARNQVAALIGAQARDIVWTSGATESDNLAIQGVVDFYAERGDHIITARSEHKAVLDCCKALERAGRARVTYLGVDRDGLVDPDELRAAITARTILITIMHANNEIGTVQPIEEIGAIARRHEILFHSDAAQSGAVLPIDVDAMNVDLLSLSAHKAYGPKGVGALFVRSRKPRVRLRPMMHGGGHERGMRSGTLNVPGIVGMGAACALVERRREEDVSHIRGLRDRFWRGLQDRLDGVQLNGHPVERHPGNVNFCLSGVDGESLLMALPDVALSSGSACTTASLEPSHVLRAIGLGDEQAQSSIRAGVGRHTTTEEIDYAIDRVAREASRLRTLASDVRMPAPV